MPINSLTELFVATADAERPIATGSYAIDPAHSRIGFVARHAMITKVRGSFNEFAGSGWFDADDTAGSNLELTILAASIDTRNAERDEHLRSDDFFNVSLYPTLQFRSTKVEPMDEARFRVTGDLNIRGVTKAVVIDFEVTGTVIDPDGVERLGLEGTSVINRKDWGLTWNSALAAGGVLVGDKISLEFDVSAIRSADDNPLTS